MQRTISSPPLLLEKPDRRDCLWPVKRMEILAESPMVATLPCLSTPSTEGLRNLSSRRVTHSHVLRPLAPASGEGPRTELAGRLPTDKSLGFLWPTAAYAPITSWPQGGITNKWNKQHSHGWQGAEGPSDRERQRKAHIGPKTELHHKPPLGCPIQFRDHLIYLAAKYSTETLVHWYKLFFSCKHSYCFLLWQQATIHFPYFI